MRTISNFRVSRNWAFHLGEGGGESVKVFSSVGEEKWVEEKKKQEQPGGGGELGENDRSEIFRPVRGAGGDGATDGSSGAEIM